MARRNEWHSGMEWASTYLEIHEGEFPNLESMAVALRSGTPMPKLVAHFLGNYLTGKIKRPRGRTKYRDVGLLDKRLEDIDLWGHYQNEYDKVKATKAKDHGTPSEIALENTAKIVSRKLGVPLTADGLKKRLKLRDRSGS